MRVGFVFTYLGEVMNIFEMAQKAGFNDGGDCIDIEKFAALVAAAARADEREACLKIISEYQIPVGSSSAGEIACEMTYGALKDIYDDIRARGTT